MSDGTPLPAPHESIELLSVVPHASYRTVEYVGPSLEAFHAAGVIDDDALARFKIGCRVVSRIVNGQIARCERRRWYSKPQGWRIIWHTHRDIAATLPGMSAETVNAGEPAMLYRERSVRIGRPPVCWTVIERKLIVIDWDSRRVRPEEAVAS